MIPPRTRTRSGRLASRPYGVYPVAFAAWPEESARMSPRSSRSNQRRPSPTTTSPHSRLRSAAIASAVVAVLAAVGWRAWRSPAYALPPSNPIQHVLLVTIDTLRADALGSYGGRATTPNLDRLAAGGARFTFAHAHAVVTLASHTSILSGRYPYEHGVRDNTGYRVPRVACRRRRRSSRRRASPPARSSAASRSITASV